MGKLNQIKAALSARLLTITEKAGYSLTLPEAHIYKFFDTQAHAAKELSKYPKIFIMTDGGELQREPSNSDWTEVSYILLGLLKSHAKESAPVEERISDFFEDVKRCIKLDYSLSGTVAEAWISAFTVDSTVLFPEAAFVARLTVRFRQVGI